MKKILLLFLSTSLYVSSQEIQKVDVVKNDNQIIELFNALGTNELKLDLIDILSVPAFDITYEKIKDS